MRERGICITFLLFAFLGIYAYIYICVCVFWKEVFLFVSLKRRFNHSYSKHTSYGPRPWSILLLVSFQKDAITSVGRPQARRQREEGNFALRLKRKNNPHLFTSQSITI